MIGKGMSQNKNWEDSFDAAHGVMAPSYSSPAPDLFYSQAAAITPWKYWGFETGSVQTGWEWGGIQAASPDRLQATQNKRAEGDQSVGFTVKPGDFVSNGARAEVVQSANNNPFFKEGDIVHYYWWTLFPHDFVPSPLWHVWTQWHQANDNACCGPDLEFVLNGNLIGSGSTGNLIGLEVYKDRNNSDILWTAPLQLGHWYRFELIVKWSTNQGAIQLRVDGLDVVNTNHITLDPNYAPYTAYMKQGLYRSKDINYSQTIYHDGMAFHYH
jgi:hypothetical protein